MVRAKPNNVLGMSWLFLSTAFYRKLHLLLPLPTLQIHWAVKTAWWCEMWILRHVRELTTFLFNILRRGCCRDYQPADAFVEEAGNIFDTFNDGTCVHPGKAFALPTQLQQYPSRSLDKGEYGINSWIFLKDGKPAFLHPLSQKGWLTDITAAQGVSRTAKYVGLKYLNSWIRIHLKTHVRYSYVLWDSLYMPRRLAWSNEVSAELWGWLCYPSG
jgi:hypothetical protein